MPLYASAHGNSSTQRNNWLPLYSGCEGRRTGAQGQAGAEAGEPEPGEVPAQRWSCHYLKHPALSSHECEVFGALAAAACAGLEGSCPLGQLSHFGIGAGAGRMAVKLGPSEPALVNGAVCQLKRGRGKEGGGSL